MNKCQEKILGIEYHRRRKTNRACSNRLKRRTTEVVRTIRNLSSHEPRTILDVGTADGLMLASVQNAFATAKCFGLDYSLELLEANKEEKPRMIQGDALELPFCDHFFEIIIATAVIEHVSDPKKMVMECFRCLEHEGILIVTCPDPFWEKIASLVGHLDREQHHLPLGITELERLLSSCGLQIIRSEKFMISPIGMAFELALERLMRMMRLDFFLLNQVVVGAKS